MITKCVIIVGRHRTKIWKKLKLAPLHQTGHNSGKKGPFPVQQHMGFDITVSPENFCNGSIESTKKCGIVSQTAVLF